MQETELKEEKKRAVQLSPGRMQEASFVRTPWVVTAEFGTTQEDLLKPEYWAHVAPNLKPYDEITVRADDGTFWAYLLVTECSRTWARVSCLQWHTLSSTDVSQTQSDAYRAEWGGPHDKHRVVRNLDNAVVAKGLSKAEAFLKKAELEKLT